MRNVSVFSRFSDKRQVDAGCGSRYGVANDVGSKLMGIITYFTHRVLCSAYIVKFIVQICHSVVELYRLQDFISSFVLLVDFVFHFLVFILTFILHRCS